MQRIESLSMLNENTNNKHIKFIDNTKEVEKYFVKNTSLRRVRLKLHPEQIRVLEMNFQVDAKPSASTKNYIANSLSLPLKNVQIWFQNRRAKAKCVSEEMQRESGQSYFNSQYGEAQYNASMYKNDFHKFSDYAAAEYKADTYPGNDYRLQPPYQEPHEHRSSGSFYDTENIPNRIINQFEGFNSRSSEASRFVNSKESTDRKPVTAKSPTGYIPREFETTTMVENNLKENNSENYILFDKINSPDGGTTIPEYILNTSEDCNLLNSQPFGKHPKYDGYFHQ